MTQSLPVIFSGIKSALDCFWRSWWLLQCPNIPSSLRMHNWKLKLLIFLTKASQACLDSFKRRCWWSGGKSCRSTLLGTARPTLLPWNACYCVQVLHSWPYPTQLAPSPAQIQASHGLLDVRSSDQGPHTFSLNLSIYSNFHCWEHHWFHSI